MMLMGLLVKLIIRLGCYLTIVDRVSKRVGYWLLMIKRPMISIKLGFCLVMIRRMMISKTVVYCLGVLMNRDNRRVGYCLAIILNRKV